MLEPETTWQALLSRERAAILGAWVLLTTEEQDSVKAHLIHMRKDEGWTDEQRESARVALEIVLEERPR